MRQATVVWAAVLAAAVAAGCGGGATRSDFSSAPAMDRAAVVAEIEQRQTDPDQRIDEFDEMILATDMDGKQLGAFMQAVRERAAKLEAWDASPEAKKLEAARAEIGAARQAKDEAKTAAAEKALEPLSADATAFREKIRADVVQVMNLDQQRDWATFVLWDHWGGLRGRFRRLDLTPEQQAQAEQVVRAEMDKVIQPGTMEKDPYLWVLRRRGSGVHDQVAQAIADQVLTPEQKAKFAPQS